MLIHASWKPGVALIAAIGLIVAHEAVAQMTPIHDGRELEAHVHLLNQSAGTSLSPPGLFAPFQTSLNPIVEIVDVGFCEAFTFQSSEFFPGAIYGSGDTYGAWQGEAVGTYDAHSLTQFVVRIDSCVTYALDATLDHPDPNTGGSIEVRAAGGGATYFHLDDGHESLTGRLSPGEYVIEGRSSVSTSLPLLTGAAYAIIWTCDLCPSPLIARHPRDTTIVCGNTASFTVVPTTATGTLTYQWRRNLVPLTNDGHTSGTASATLSINSACSADTGHYDVVLSDGGILEPSRLAHLGLVAVGGVEATPVTSPLALTLESAAPNPFQSSIAIRYTAHRALHASAAIYDAAGRLVRPLANRVLSGPGTLTWDGRAMSGERVPVGIYFLRLNADGESCVRRIVRLE